MKDHGQRAMTWMVLVIALLWAWVPAPAGALYAGLGYGPSMTTVQYDNARTGWNPYEVTLTPETVRPETFGKLWTATLSGQIYAAPLYVSGVVIDGEPRNVAYVATQDNYIYALDAETGQSVWPMPYLLGMPGSRALLQCGNISPNIGITSTPVIDLEAGTLYAVGLTREDSTQVFKMAAVDLATGESRPGWPVTIMPPANLTIDTRVTGQRGALLLANGRVYVGFGGLYGDCGPYHGWVVGVDPSNPMPSAQIYYRTPGTPTHRGSGIWAGGGLAADEKYLYAPTGNSFMAPPGSVDYSNAVLRLTPDLSFSEQPEDYFIPSNWRILNGADADLGSSTPLLLPPQPESTTPNMIFITGKAGVGHLLNRDNLGGLGTGDGVNGEGIYSTRLYGGAYSTAAYYEDPVNGPMIFLSGFGTHETCRTRGTAALSLGVTEEGDSLYRTLWCTPDINIAMSPLVTGAPGTTGVVWVVSIVEPNGVLYAFNAATGDPLYNSNMVAEDALGTTRHSATQRGNQHFAVAGGKVFVPTEPNRIVAYGLRPEARPK